MQAVGIAPDGSTQSRVTVQVAQAIRVREIATLPYIFFDENSAQLPARYLNAQPGDARDPLSRYRAMLGTLGQRLAAAPSQQITIVGTNANVGDEAGNTTLSRQRAQAVKEYLVANWGIAPDRIRTEARGLPETPSNSAYPEGREENRRAEIVADAALLHPLQIADTTRTITSPGLQFQNSIRAEAGVAGWEISASINGRQIRRLRGERQPPAAMNEQFTTQELARLSEGETAIGYSMSVSDSAGQTTTTTAGTLPVEVTRTSVEEAGEGASLQELGEVVVFDFNSARLRTEAKLALARLRERLPKGGSIAIRGYADEIGDPAVNLRLSTARARAVAAEFRDFTVTIEEPQSSTPLFPNDTPEGRFYSRTVRVRVQ